MSKERPKVAERRVKLEMPYRVAVALIASNPEYWLRVLGHRTVEIPSKYLPCQVLGVNRRADDPDWDDEICERLCDINPCAVREKREKQGRGR